MKKFIIFCLLFSTFLPVLAADWVQVYEKAYIDRESITYFNDYRDRHVSFWLKSLNDKSKIYIDLEKYSKSKVWYDKTLWDVNCTQKEIAIKETIAYDLNHNVVYSNDPLGDNWRKIVPDTIGEFYYDLFCK